MPCDRVRQVRVLIVPVTVNTFEVGARDRTLLAEALQTLQVSDYAYDGSRLVVRTRGRSELTTDQIKVAYSQQVVKKVAKRYGWALQETRTAREIQYTVSKR